MNELFWKIRVMLEKHALEDRYCLVNLVTGERLIFVPYSVSPDFQSVMPDADKTLRVWGTYGYAWQPLEQTDLLTRIEFSMIADVEHLDTQPPPHPDSRLDGS